MDTPLGRACGNGLEVAESLEVLRGGGPADVVEVTDVPARIAAVLGTELVADSDPVTQLTRIVHDRHVLLMLDNAEHLRPLPLSGLLSACPRLTLLVTSRERLDVAEERLYPVRGLEQPAGEAPSGAEPLAASVALFVERATQVEPRFAPSDDELEGIAGFCRLVEGSPLAIELAAALIRVMPCSAIIEEVSHSLDVLARRHGVADERHTSMRAVFESSWSRLDELERRALAGVAVFEGGFRREAAAAICGVSIGVLMALVDKSLVRVDHDRRFDLHPLARQFALEKLSERPTDLAEVRERHGRWYLRFAREREEGLWTRSRRSALAVIGPELANLRAAWRWAISVSDVDELVASAWAYDSIYQHHMRQAYTVFEEAVDGLDERDPSHHRALGHALTYLAHFAHFEPEIDTRAIIDRALALLRPLGDDIGEMRALVRLGFSQLFAGEREAARATWERGLQLARGRGTARDRGVFLTILVDVTIEAASLEDAEPYFEQLFDEMARFGTEVHLVHVKRSAAWYYLQRGERERAHTLFEEVTSLARRLGDRRLEPFGYVIRRALTAGDHDRAETVARDAVDVYRADGNRHQELGAVMSLAHVQIGRRSYREARATGERALRIAWETSDDAGAVGALLVLSECATGLGLPVEAARYLGVIRSITAPPDAREHVEALMKRVREVLGEQAFAAEVGHGERGGLSALLAS